MTINHFLFIVKAGGFKAEEKIALPALKDAYQNVTGKGYTFKCNKIRFWIPKVERMCSAEMVFTLPVGCFRINSIYLCHQLWFRE